MNRDVLEEARRFCQRILGEEDATDIFHRESLRSKRRLQRRNMLAFTVLAGGAGMWSGIGINRTRRVYYNLRLRKAKGAEKDKWRKKASHANRTLGRDLLRGFGVGASVPLAASLVHKGLEYNSPVEKAYRADKHYEKSQRKAGVSFVSKEQADSWRQSARSAPKPILGYLPAGVPQRDKYHRRIY
jgi:hypothetical protein